MRHNHRRSCSGVVIKETSNRCVDTELQNQVSSPVKLSTNGGDIKQGLALVDEPKTAQENQEAVTNVTRAR